MQTIQTYYIGPTNTRGGRIAAKTAAGHRLVLSWDYSVGPEENHRHACLALMNKMDWTGEMIAGDNGDGSQTWVFNESFAPRVTREYVGA